MEYGKIVAVTGLPGLYELLSSKTDGAIVRSLDDKTTRFVASRVHNFSHLESIEVFTVRDNVNLVDILNAMDKSSEKLPDAKDNRALKNYFEKVFPDLDFERVYTSDMKKMVKWFEVLKANNIEIKLTEVAEPTPEPVEEKPPVAKKATEPAKEKEKPAPAAKEKTKAVVTQKAAPKKETKETVTKKEAKAAPKKKAAAKPKKEEAAPKKKTAAKKTATKKK